MLSNHTRALWEKRDSALRDYILFFTRLRLTSRTVFI